MVILMVDDCDETDGSNDYNDNNYESDDGDEEYDYDDDISNRW